MEITFTGEILESRTISVEDYNVKQINSIKKKYPELRNLSKAPTFALTYAGTFVTLMNNCGFSEEQAKEIEKRYHDLYTESDDWIKLELDKACVDGYATLAFGLRLRTPVLAKSILNSSITANISSAEARSAGNAISGQSYGMLNNRAVVAFMERVWDSPYKYDILPISLIHDAGYFMIKDDANVLRFVNDNLIECMSWQELPEIMHPDVHLTADLDLFHPSWSNPIELPHNATARQLRAFVKSKLSS